MCVRYAISRVRNTQSFLSNPVVNQNYLSSRWEFFLENLMTTDSHKVNSKNRSQVSEFGWRSVALR